jgi:competence ComEA-like helix-hairpin-helix protein
MGIRSTVANLIGGEATERHVREIVEEILANRGFARPADLQELRDRVAALESGGSDAADTAFGGRSNEALTKEVEALRKKITMAMGAIQAATAQLADVRRATDEARAEARKALARAESALATAESVSEGVDALEDAVEQGGGDSAEGDSAGDDRLDLNRATAADLEALPGIGPSMAVRIVEDREANGRFHKVGDLSRVKGLGVATVKRLSGHLRV